MDNKENNQPENHFNVEKILKHHQYPDGTTYFLIKWEGYNNEEDNTWEPLEGLYNCKKVLKDYIKDINLEGQIKTRNIRWLNPEKEKLIDERTKNFTCLSDIIYYINQLKKLKNFNRSPIGEAAIINKKLEDNEWENNKIYLLSYHEHLFVLLTKEKGNNLLLDGANEIIKNKNLLAEITKNYNLPGKIKTIKYISQTGNDHCGSSGAIIALNLMQFYGTN